MQTIFRVWLTPSHRQLPNWQAMGAKIVKITNIAADGWDVTVEGDGAEFEKRASEHADIATVELVESE